MPNELDHNLPGRRTRHAPYRMIWRVLGCFCFVWLATFLGLPLHAGNPIDAIFIWVANGVLLSYLLLAPRRSWPAYLAAGLLAHLAAIPFRHSSLALNLLFVPHDPVEVLFAALLLRRRSPDLPNFTSLAYLKRFALFALLVASLGISVLYAGITSSLFHLNYLRNLVDLYSADSIGLMVSVPACVAVFRARLRRTFGLGNICAYTFLVVAANLVLFTQAEVPISFVLLPLLVMVLLRWGLGWASLGSLASAGIGAVCTANGFGPFAAIQDSSVLPASILFQIFIVSVMVVLYSVSVVVENLRTTERRLQRMANLHTLVAENSRDVIILIDSGGRHLISAPERFWGGWTRHEIGGNSMSELVHPEDRNHLSEVERELRRGKDGDLVEFRVMSRNGGYTWLESSMRCVRDPIGKAPSGILASIREIGERKRAEEELREAYRAVEALAVTDPLTDLANRRRFEEVLAKEWRRALREKSPLSLLLIDADSFKAYNDMYGHRNGDDCLKEIADAVGAGAARPGDLSSRIGGDEFALLLPGTGEEGARLIGHKVAEMVRARAIAHEGSPTGHVSVSVGCGTLVPQPGQTSTFLFDLADEALYAAKGSGRNKVCSRAFPHATGQAEVLQTIPGEAN